MKNEQFSRTIGLINPDNFSLIQNKKILIAGLGGVGGTVFEALVRTGFVKFVIVDYDRVSISNLNRQILYVHQDLGKLKVDVAKEKAIKINPNIEVSVLPIKINEDFSIDNVDFIVDCVDDIFAKIQLVKIAQNNNIPIVCSMGMANKVNPSCIAISKLNNTTNDPLAKKFRYELKKQGINFHDINVVYSKETPIKNGNELSSIVTTTSMAGLYLAYFVISYFIKK